MERLEASCVVNSKIVTTSYGGDNRQHTEDRWFVVAATSMCYVLCSKESR